MLFVIIGLVNAAFGVAPILASFRSSNPHSLIEVTQRDEGVVIIGFDLLGTAISYEAFRRGERWAWYVALFVPVDLVRL